MIIHHDQIQMQFELYKDHAVKSAFSWVHVYSIKPASTYKAILKLGQNVVIHGPANDGYLL